ncbi:MAG: Glycolate dehydrogenase, FAD-binding subunit GlcE [uncultured Chloroflexi bacterium]|uniref:Glycolate dehydrogenase, FAD-binding subunit GlcE n=1 Tax=uncultured Chloroflexota bacterium TaxID=166587 RepID=A0A6J4JVC1_9CHLR|nr:MAG: Glycolate dehydrogenase, FAD-binding subunit GlcE [uncultured Chloroflexota bacterium]
MTATASRTTTDYSIAVLTPSNIERPATPEAVAVVLGRASEAGQAVIPWGAGTKQRQGNAPRAYDVALDVSGMNELLEYEPADLVVTVQAGVTLAALQARLAESGQFLPLDPPYAQRATIGGTLATNASGPSRLLHGTARDLVIGLRVATPQGEIVKSGGKVVKNVVGYDLNKLHVGGMGTAGVIVEATFKVHPLPAAQATIAATFQQLATAHAAAGRITRSFLYPRAVDLVRNIDGKGTSTGWTVLTWSAGSPATVDRQARDVAQWCSEGGATHVERLDGEAHDAVWASVIESGRDEPGAMALVKLSCLPSQLPALIAEVDRHAGSSPPVPLVAHAGNGVVYVRLPGATLETVRRIAAATHELGGSAILEDAPDALKAQVDAWDPSGLAARRRDDFDLMRAIKTQFDPNSTLNPGRFVAGI